MLMKLLSWLFRGDSANQDLPTSPTGTSRVSLSGLGTDFGTPFVPSEGLPDLLPTMGGSGGASLTDMTSTTKTLFDNDDDDTFHDEHEGILCDAHQGSFRDAPPILTKAGARGFVVDGTPKEKASNPIATHQKVLETNHQVKKVGSKLDSHIKLCKQLDDIDQRDKALQRYRANVYAKGLSELGSDFCSHNCSHKESNNARVDGLESDVVDIKDRLGKLEKSCTKAPKQDIDSLRVVVRDNTGVPKDTIRSFVELVVSNARVGAASIADIDFCLSFDSIKLSMEKLRMLLDRGYRSDAVLVAFVRSMEYLFAQGSDTKTDMQRYLLAVLAHLSDYAMAEDPKQCPVPFRAPHDFKGKDKPRVTKQLATKLFSRLRELEFYKHPEFSLHHNGRKIKLIKIEVRGEGVVDKQDRLFDYLSGNYDKKW